MNKDTASNMALHVMGMRAQIDGVLSACEPGTERELLERARIALDRLSRFYINCAAERLRNDQS